MPTGFDNYLTVFGPECKRRLTHTYGEEVAEFMFLITKMQETLAAYRAQRTAAEEKFAREPALCLMYKSANTLMASLELALSGYHWEPPILFRNALEGCAVAWDIVTNEKRFKLWETGKHFKSSDSVSQLQKVDWFYGEIWGFLSNTKVHITKKNCSPPLFATDTGPVFQLFGLVPEGMEEKKRNVVEASIMAAHTCLRLTEIVFFPFITNPETVKLDRGGQFVTSLVTDRYRRFDSFAKRRDSNA